MSNHSPVSCPSVFSVMIPTFMGMLAFLNQSGNWVNENTWSCLKQITSNLTTHTRYVSLDENSPPSWLWNEFPVYDTESTKLKDYSYEADAVILMPKIERRRIPNVVGRKVIVTTNLDKVYVLWSFFRLVDVVLLVQGESETKVYSWFPYQRKDCSLFPNLEVIDYCVNGSLKYGIDLFPVKIPNKLDGCPITVSVRQNPYAEVHSTPIFEGFEWRILHTTAKSLGLKLNIVSHKFEEVIEFRKRNGTYGKIYGDLHNYRIDVVVGGYLLARRWYEVADTLPSHRSYSLKFFVPTPSPKRLTSGLYSGFSIFTWGLILIIIILFTVTTFFASKFTMIESALYSVQIVLGLPNKYIQRATFLTCFLWILFQLYSLHIIWFYQTTLLSNLFKIPYTKSYKTLEDAVNGNLILMVYPFYFDFIEDSNRKAIATLLESRRYISNDSLDLSLLTESKKAFYLGWLGEIKAFLQYYYPDQHEGTIIDVLRETYLTVYGAIYTAKNHVLRPLLSNKIYQIIESGLRDVWLEQELDLNWRRAFASTFHDKPLGINHLQSAFFVIISLWLFSIVVFFCECIYFRVTNRKQETKIKRQKPSTRRRNLLNQKVWQARKQLLVEKGFGKQMNTSLFVVSDGALKRNVMHSYSEHSKVLRVKAASKRLKAAVQD